MEKHLCIDCTLIKNHPDPTAYMDYLVDNRFVHNLENLPSGLRPRKGTNYIDFIFFCLCTERLSVHDEHDVSTDVAVLVNMDGTRIELIINADGSESRTTERRIARNALVKYLGELGFAQSDDFVVFHLGEVLNDAYQEHELPSGVNYKVVDTPFHGEIISNILNNISIRRHDKNIEKVITEALGITREQAMFDHVFYPDAKCDFQGDDQEYALDMTYFDYRGKRLILFLTADEKGHQAIELSQSRDGARVKVDEIHDLKSVIDKEFFNDAPVETPKEEPVETPQEEPEAERDISVSFTTNIKANTYIEAYTKKANDIISRMENGKDWFAKFKEVATPEEIVGYYFHTYGVSKALYWWKTDFEKTERTDFNVSVDRIFDSIFCPFCKQKKRVSFGSTEVSLQYQEDGKVHCYHKDEYTGTMDFPNCPQCGSKLE